MERESGLSGTECRHEEEHACYEERQLASQTVGKPSGDKGSDDAANECAAACESVDEIGVLEVSSTQEISLQAFLGTRDDGSVVAKKQSAKHSC